MRLAICLTIWLVQTFALANTNKGKYTVIAPGTIYSNENYTATVAVHHTSQPCHIDVSIIGPSLQLTQTVLMLPDEVKNVEFELPSLQERGNYDLTAQSVDCFENFRNSTKLEYYKFDNHAIIQTDRGVYEPGDVINFRILFMDKDLKPVEPEKDAVIWIQNGEHETIEKLIGFKTINGVYTGNFTISELEPTGYWRVNVKNGDADTEDVYFLVDKIRSKYVVKVEASESWSIRDGEMEVIVLANHVSGKPLQGKATIALDFDVYTLQKRAPPILKTANMVNGKAKFSLDLKQYDGYLRKEIYPTGMFSVDVKEYGDYLEKEKYPTGLNIVATVVENSTGVRIKDKTRSQIYPYRYSMHCVNYEACSSFEGDKEKNLLFQITSYDGSSLNDTKSTIELIYKEYVKYKWSHPRTVEGTTQKPPLSGNRIVTYKGHMNETGFVNFTVLLPELQQYEDYTHFYSLQMKYLDEQREIASSFQRKEQKEVETSKEEDSKDYFILMDQSPFSNTELSFKKPYEFTVNSSQPLSYFDYNIIGRGNILKSGRVDLSHKAKIYNLSLTPEASWARSFALYVYYVDENGGYHYAEKKYRINESINPITVTVSEHAKPGDEVKLTIQTAPNSFVGLMAVDQRVFQLEEKPYDLKRIDVEGLLDYHGTTTPHQGGYSKYPGTTSGCVTLTNADYFYNWTRPIYRHYFGSYIRNSPNKAAASKPLSAQDVTELVDDDNDEDFLKTWIFADFVNTTTTEFSHSIKLPVANTTWVLTSFSLNPSKGLGVAENKIKSATNQPLA